MLTNRSDIIYPCPFSKGYGMPAGQAWQVLKIYYIYRFTLAASFCLLFYFRYGPSFLGSSDGKLYLFASITYEVLTLWLGFCIIFRWLSYSILCQLLILTDIFTLTMVMLSSGGVTSGMGILIAVSIAAGGLLVGGRCAVVFAAIASIFVLSVEVYTDHNEITSRTNYTFTGMLGAAYFAIALLSVIMAKRSEQMLALTGQQQETIIQLEEFNRYIIQHLQSGLIIADKNEKLLMANRATLRLTELPELPDTLAELSKPLSAAFAQWLDDPRQDIFMLKLRPQAEIQCRFVMMPTYNQEFYLLILEDTALYNQRLQQSKLASLGRLTASIAHEIRNPLGAIGHAGQLLSENPELSSQDKRLTGIIQSNTSRVNQIIEDILSLSRRTDSNREKINLPDWLTDYLDNFYIEHTTSSGFKLELPEAPLFGIIDPAHLKQIMDNLCQNALRYGEPQMGDILIRLRDTSLGPCLEVIDNGPGIKPEHFKQLFEPFFTTSSSGTGLGLYISRELAELNQAKLSYYLTDNQQSCFRLCLQDANLTTIEI